MATEKRLIDANAFESNIRKMFISYGDGTYPGDYEAMIHDETLVDVLATIEEAPTVDAVEVVHGRWIDDGGLDEDGNGQYRCTCCGAGEKHNPTVAVSYCWNCGAKMDGGNI